MLWKIVLFSRDFRDIAEGRNNEERHTVTENERGK